jgi:hypothetical protein
MDQATWTGLSADVQAAVRTKIDQLIDQRFAPAGPLVSAEQIEAAYDPTNPEASARRQAALSKLATPDPLAATVNRTQVAEIRRQAKNRPGTFEVLDPRTGTLTTLTDLAYVLVCEERERAEAPKKMKADIREALRTREADLTTLEARWVETQKAMDTLGPLPSDVLSDVLPESVVWPRHRARVTAINAWRDLEICEAEIAQLKRQLKEL